MVGVLERFLPSFGVDIKLLEDPQAIHEEVHKLWLTLNQLLQEDHEKYGITGCSCVAWSVDSAEGRQESAESVLRGNDGERQEHPHGSADVELHQGVLDLEVPSENTNSRHKTTFQSRT